MIADDEVEFLKRLSKRLSLRDFVVVAVTDGDEAVAAA
ncbi:MAG: hybrid sensor histidine kinase/response regulator, partial [Deltaproteobacteria bacterium]